MLSPRTSLPCGMIQHEGMTAASVSFEWWWLLLLLGLDGYTADSALRRLGRGYPTNEEEEGVPEKEDEAIGAGP